MTPGRPPVPSVGGMDLLHRTFGADSWRRVGYAAVSAPVGLVALLLTPVRPRRAAELQRRVAGRLLGGPPPGRARVPGSVGYALLSLPLGVLGLWLAFLLVPNTIRNLLYGVFPEGDYSHAWGGPTLAGAWAVHAAGALALVPVGLWLLRGLTALQRRLADALLGPAPLSAPLTGLCAIVVLIGGVLLRAFLHQA